MSRLSALLVLVLASASLSAASFHPSTLQGTWYGHFEIPSGDEKCICTVYASYSSDINIFVADTICSPCSGTSGPTGRNTMSLFFNTTTNPVRITNVYVEGSTIAAGTVQNGLMVMEGPTSFNLTYNNPGAPSFPAAMGDGVAVSFIRAPRTALPGLVGRWRGEMDFPSGSSVVVSSVIDTNLAAKNVIFDRNSTNFNGGVFYQTNVQEKTLIMVFTTGMLPAGTFQYSRYVLGQDSLVVVSSPPNVAQFPDSVESPCSTCTRVKFLRENA